MSRLFDALPGPTVVKVVIVIVVVAAMLLVLHLIYSWMGTNLLDPGGGVG